MKKINTLLKRSQQMTIRIARINESRKIFPLLVCLFLFLPSLLFSASIQWSGAVSNEWNVAGNWSTNTIPTTADDVTLSGAFTINVPNGYIGSAGSLIVSGTAYLHIQSGATLNVESLSVAATQFSVKVDNGSILNDGTFTMIGGLWLDNSSTLTNDGVLINFGDVDNSPICFYLTNQSSCTNLASSNYMTSRNNTAPNGDRKDAFIQLEGSSEFLNFSNLYTTYQSSFADYMINGIVVKNGSHFDNADGFINLNWIQQKGIHVYNDGGNTDPSLFENRTDIRNRETDIDRDNTSRAIHIETYGTYKHYAGATMSMTVGAGSTQNGYSNTTPQVDISGILAYSTVSTFDPKNVSIATNGALAGSGPINNSQINWDGGRVSPGESPGIISFTEPFSPTTITPFTMELAGTGGAGASDGHDQVVFQSTPNDITNVTIDVTLIDGFVPAVNDQFILFDGTYTGTFNAIELPGSSSSWDVQYNSNDITLVLVSPVTNLGNVGVGTEAPKTKLHVSDGDVYLESLGSGVIMKDANGDCRRLTIDGSGVITAPIVTCPN